MNTKIAKKINQNFYYGWVIVGLAALSLFFSSPGQSYGISTFINSYIETFQISRTTISVIYSTATLISGLSLLGIGKLVDRFGQRIVFIFCGVMLAITCIFNSFISGIYMIFFGFLASRYFGQGSLALIPSTLVPQWFKGKRALAIGIYGIGGSLASVSVPALNIWMINNYGWQSSWRIWSLLIILIFLPLMWTLVVNTPEEIGVLPDNKSINSIDDINEERVSIEQNSWTLKNAMKTKEFWFLGFCVTITPMITTGLVFHFFSIMSEKGIYQSQAAYILGLMGLPGFIAPIIGGFILDKWNPKYVFSITFVIETFALLILIFVKTPIAAVLFMLIYGIAKSVQDVSGKVMWPNYFGRKYLGSIQAAATMFIVIGSAFGPIPFGAVFDNLGSYNWAIIAMAFISLLSSIIGLLCNKPKLPVTFENNTFINSAN